MSILWKNTQLHSLSLSQGQEAVQQNKSELDIRQPENKWAQLVKNINSSSTQVKPAIIAIRFLKIYVQVFRAFMRVSSVVVRKQKAAFFIGFAVKVGMDMAKE